MRPIIKNCSIGTNTHFEIWIDGDFFGQGPTEEAAKADLLRTLHAVIARGKRAEIVRFRLDLSPPSTAMEPGDR